MSRGSPRWIRSLGTLAALCWACALGSAAASAAPPTGIHKIQHVIIIIQENRSFDSYFGTFPGAVGIPMRNGVPTVCIPNPAAGVCVRPFPNHHDVNGGGPHVASASLVDVDRGKMDGFIVEAEAGHVAHCEANPTNPRCTNSGGAVGVVGYHTESDIPNYWAYAKRFVLQDHMFESVHTWSLPSHLAILSGWTAVCMNPNDPMSCTGSLMPINRTASNPTPYAWTDITYLLYKHHVTWVNYLDGGPADGGSGIGLGPKVPSIWNVLPGFTDVHQDGQLQLIQPLAHFFAAAQNGTLPAVSWIFPSSLHSEHPPAKVSAGQSYVTGLVNAVMRSPDWSSSAIFITWDDWGGFYDNVAPPQPYSLGYGIRVPGLVISPYAKPGFIDHQTLSFDAYLKFIEDDFLGGQRLNPATDGRPDSRPVVVENLPQLGDLRHDFNFNQKPLPPLLLPVDPHTTLVESGNVQAPPADILPISKST